VLMRPRCISRLAGCKPLTQSNTGRALMRVLQYRLRQAFYWLKWKCGGTHVLLSDPRDKAETTPLSEFSF